MGGKALFFLNTNILINLGNGCTSLLLLLLIPSSWVLCQSLALALCGTTGFPSCWSSSRALHMSTVTHTPAPLGGVQSPVMLISRVSRSPSQQLTQKSIANPSMQQYFVLNKTWESQDWGETVDDRRKSLHLLGTALNQQNCLVQPALSTVFPHVFSSSYFLM